MDPLAVRDELAEIREAVQLLALDAYEIGNGNLAVWAEKVADDADQFLMQMEQEAGE